MTYKNSKNILHVTHSWGGGIPVYISELQEILSNDFNIYILKCAKGKLILERPGHNEKVVCYELLSNMKLLEITDSKYKNILELILRANSIDLIHVNITLSHTFDVFYVACELNIPVIYTVHDYFYICPTFHLVNKNGIHCHVCEYGKEDEECIDGHPYLVDKGFNKDKLYKWRTEFNNIKGMIDLFIFPSISCKNIFTNYYDIKPELCQVIPHGTSLKASKDAESITAGGLRVGILGTMLKHKGEEMYRHILGKVDDNRIKFYHFGDGCLENEKLINIGAYKRDNIISLMKENKIDVVLLLSTWPETFSYTLSETIAAGIPPIVTNLGALSERVEKTGIGWIVDYRKPDEVCDLLSYLLLNPHQIKNKQEHLQHLPKNTVEEMKAVYQATYSSIISANNKSIVNAASTVNAIKALDKHKTVCEKNYAGKEELSDLELFKKSLNSEAL